MLRANAYVAADFDREALDQEYARRNKEFRNAIRRSGFHLLVKKVRRFMNEDGETILKANADLDLAVDALVQSENLDYILLGTGDGDFVRLVRTGDGGWIFYLLPIQAMSCGTKRIFIFPDF
jgi:uncharacterized LabA/DUF88 family protein